MLSSAIIVFREVFEIVLIVGVVLAATRGMSGQGKAIALGITGGLVGAGLIALFIDNISNMAEGMGQEIFNASILFVAAAFIGWTVLWIKKHANEMRAKFTKVGQEVAAGKTSWLVLSAIIALAVWREGSEIVMFSYGMLASGQSVTEILSGAMIGILGGLTVGGLLYLGMIKIPMKLFFQVTSALLILLVAGMVSQGFGYLVMTGAFENLSNTVWDTSWLLSEENLLGETLKVLIGYTSTPTAIQLIAYMLTIGVLIMGLKAMENKSFDKTMVGNATIGMLFIAALFFALPAKASKTVTSPNVTKGKLELVSKTGYEIDEEDEADGALTQKLGAEYGVSERWGAEIVGEWEREGDDDAETEFTTIELESKLMLTNPGDNWADLGLKFSYAHDVNDNPDKIEIKGIVAKKVGNFTHTANAIIEREIGDNSSDETEYGTAFNSRYRMSEHFQPGLEMYNDYGNFEDDFNDQKHMIGPVAKGKLMDNIAYDTGVLFGISEAAPDATLKLILKYEHQF